MSTNIMRTNWKLNVSFIIPIQMRMKWEQGEYNKSTNNKMRTCGESISKNWVQTKIFMFSLLVEYPKFISRV